MDYAAARFNFEGKFYDVAAFLCQQSIEKGLKALRLKRGKKLEKIHDLILLGKSVRLPKRLLNYCKEITAAYIYTRYPGLPRSKDMQKNSKNFIRQTEEILRWIKKRL